MPIRDLLLRMSSPSPFCRSPACWARSTASGRCAGVSAARCCRRRRSRWPSSPMSPSRQPRGTASPYTWVVEGAIGGIAAALAYDLYRLPFVLNETTLFKVFPRFGKLLLGAEEPHWLVHFLGWAYHFSNGAALGDHLPGDGPPPVAAPSSGRGGPKGAGGQMHPAADAVHAVLRHPIRRSVHLPDGPAHTWCSASHWGCGAGHGSGRRLPDLPPQRAKAEEHRHASRTRLAQRNAAVAWRLEAFVPG